MIVTATLNPSLDEWVSLPRLRLGELNRARDYYRYPAGKGINVARAVSELGLRATAVALAGGDDGQILDELLTKQNIPHRFVTVPGSTRNNYQIQTDSPRALTQINCPGPRVSKTALREVERILHRLTARASCVVLSGSLPPQAPSSTYQRLIGNLKQACDAIVLDTSGSALLQGLSAKPWFIKPNRHEAEEILGERLGRASQIIKAARRLVDLGPSLSLISLGQEGAVLASKTQREVLWAEPPSVPVDSPVGAGDCLVAGFVVGWLKTGVLSEALRLGVACGAACVMTPGTELCRRSDVERLRKRVRIKTIYG